jgi:exopolyphosphatase/guanosine-5'-triphosphate,3'-diphosphate pyrophosphatase
MAEKSAAFLRQVARGDFRQLRSKGSNGLQELAARCCPMARLVLQQIIAAMKPSKIVVSALGVREGFLYSLLPVERAAADPLISAAEELAHPAVAFGRACARTGRVDGETCWPRSALTRPRTRRAIATPPACWPTSAGAPIPEYRGTQSLNIIAHASFIGVDHPGRALHRAGERLYRHDGVFATLPRAASCRSCARSWRSWRRVVVADFGASGVTSISEFSRPP